MQYTGFFDWGTCDLDVRIWVAGQPRPRKSQIAVEDASGNWYSDPERRQKGKQKAVSCVVNAPAGGTLRLIYLQFQNSDGRTVESPVFEIPVCRLAALTYKNGQGELKLESYPASRPPRRKKGVVTFELQELPKLEMDFD